MSVVHIAQGESLRIWKDIESAKGGASVLLGFIDASEGQPLVVTFGTMWQRLHAYLYGRGRAIMLDATHSTNGLKVCPPGR